MTEELDNPLDDELLRELGLEPTPPPVQTPSPKPESGKPEPGKPESGKPKAPPVSTKGAPTKTMPSKVAPPHAALAVSPSHSAAVSKAPAPSDEERFGQGIRDLAEDMPVQVVAVLGKRSLTLKELVALKPGEILELKKIPQDAIDLVANGKLVARGELVLIDGKLGIQIKQLV